MAYGILKVLFFGLLTAGFEKFHQSENKKLDRIEIESHTWIGCTGKGHIHRRYLGPIQKKTFLSTSRLMVSRVKEYESLLRKLHAELSDPNLHYETNDHAQLIDLHEKIKKHMRQIDRREPLRCYVEWKDDHVDSFLNYQEARTKFLELDSKHEDVELLLYLES